MDFPTLGEKLDALPARPGCYVFLDGSGQTLYVGKAKSLRARVRSYFQAGSSDDRPLLPLLLDELRDFETIVTRSEKEAAILENNLIKERRPRFNVKLRDDKEFLTLRLSREQAWPRLELVRRPKADGARYFGPYHSATAARRTLHLVEKHFQLRTCSDRELKSRSRPCLQYQIQRCPAPCVCEVDRGHYQQQVHAVELFLLGRHDELIRELDARMHEASASMHFELAATYRDQIRAVAAVLERQTVVTVTDKDQDVLGMYREGDLVELVVLRIRAGRWVDALRDSSARVEVPDEEVVAAFLRDYYGDGAAPVPVPDEVLLPLLPEGVAGIGEWLTERRAEFLGRPTARVQLLAPARGPRAQLLGLAVDNARHAFEEKQRASEDMEARLTKIQRRLRLPHLPRRIECCDISHLGGQDTVGAVVALLDGVPDKPRYRSYKVRSTSGGDDYGAMQEVLRRRFLRGKGSPAGGDWSLPDLFVVDGGRGQLAVALTAARDLGLVDLSIVGLAKERESVTGARQVDRVYLPNQKNPIPLQANGAELFVLALARDEAHRFSNHGRRKVGKRRRLGSELEQLQGIGPKTRQALLKHLGSVAAVRVASDEQLLAVPGVTRRHVLSIRERWPSDRPPPKTGN